MRSVLRSRFSRNNIERAQASSLCGATGKMPGQSTARMAVLRISARFSKRQAASLFQRYRKRVGQRQHWPHAGSKEDPEKEQFGNKMLMHFRVQKFSAQITKRPPFTTNVSFRCGLHFFARVPISKIFFVGSPWPNPARSHVTNCKDYVTNTSLHTIGRGKHRFHPETSRPALG